MRISTSSIHRIRETCDLQALAADYATLRRSGSGWVCLCPFHRERNPSCRVYRDHYFCFTCNAHGSAIDWVIHHEQVRFADAAKIIADRIGVSLDERPVSRVAMQYAREEAEFCKWWWADRRRRLRASLDAALAEDDEMVAEFFGLRLRWSPAPAEAFRFFQMRRTDADRARWKNEMAEEKLFKDMWMALADGIGVRRAA